jgi:hypothetical protein
VPKPIEKKIVEIKKRQYMPFPQSNRVVIGGPAKVETTMYDDGTTRVRVLEGKTSPIELAMAQKWQRLSY